MARRKQRVKESVFRATETRRGAWETIKISILRKEWLIISAIVTILGIVVAIVVPVGTALLVPYEEKRGTEEQILIQNLNTVKDKIIKLREADEDAYNKCLGYQSLTKEEKIKVVQQVSITKGNIAQLVEDVVPALEGLKKHLPNNDFEQILSFVKWNDSFPSNLCTIKLISPQVLKVQQEKFLTPLENLLGQ